MPHPAASRIRTIFLLAGLLPAIALAQTPGASLMPADGGASVAKHFDPLGQPASRGVPPSLQPERC